MTKSKKALTLLEVVIAMALVSLGLCGLGFKFHTLIQKKKFSSQLDRVLSRMQMLHSLSVTTGRDYYLSLHQEKENVICRSCFLKENNLIQDTPLTIDGVQLILGLAQSDRLDLVFYSSGQVQSTDCLHVVHKTGEKTIHFEDFFSQQQGKSLGPIYPKNLKS